MPKGKHRAGKVAHKKSKPPIRRRIQPARNARRGAKSRNVSGYNGAKIEEYMTTHGVIRRPIIGDGNCLFRALADQLGLGENRHREIRDKVVETIKLDKDYFVNFIDEDDYDGVDAYCDDMIKDGTWGDDIELEAFRRAYERAIVIYDASTGTPYVKPFNGDEGTSLSTVHLWKSDCHYESVRNIEGPFDGPSRVVYKDVKISKEDMERIKQEHEDVVVEEVRQAAPHIHPKEIRKLVKEYGDGNKVLELLTGQPSNTDHQEQLPDEEMTESPNNEIEETETPQTDYLAASMEILSLDPTTEAVMDKPEEIPESAPATPRPSGRENAKDKARQRRHVSSARKEKQAKRAQKEAAKHRKRMEAMGVEHIEEKSEQEHILKAIVI